MDRFEVGVVLDVLGRECWLAGELALVRDGVVCVRMFPAPDRDTTRWLAVIDRPRTVLLLERDHDLENAGWPGARAVVSGEQLDTVAYGAVTTRARGEFLEGWAGDGRYALLRGPTQRALCLDVNGALLALAGCSVDESAIETLGIAQQR